MGFKTIAKDLKMPIWDSHLLGTVNDRVPQGLYVFDLLVDRELVETGRWIRNWLSHSCTLAPRELWGNCADDSCTRNADTYPKRKRMKLAAAL